MAENENTWCNGLCLTGWDIGLSVGGVAYPHPLCPRHGSPHSFEFSGNTHRTHYGLERLCVCGEYEMAHKEDSSIGE